MIKDTRKRQICTFQVRIFSAWIKDIEPKPTPTPWGAKMPLGQMMTEFSNSTGGGEPHYPKQWLKRVVEGDELLQSHRVTNDGVDYVFVYLYVDFVIFIYLQSLCCRTEIHTLGLLSAVAADSWILQRSKS